MRRKQMNLNVTPDCIRSLTACALLLFLVSSAISQTRSRKLQNPTSGDPVSRILLLRIVRAEDERRWDNDLRELFKARNANVRARAALAAGRIGTEEAVADLIPLLQRDDEPEVRAMAAFALGEIESPLGADALVALLSDLHDSPQRSRAVEALGKITAALPKEQEKRAHELAAVVLEALNFEASRRSAPDNLTILLGLTAVLRAKPDGAGPIVARFLHYSDPRVRADAANTLARLKLKDGNEELRKLLVSDPDPVVRANAARVIGATEDRASFDALLDRALKDKDSRVRVSAIRALGALKDLRAADPLTKQPIKWKAQNEALELITALGNIFASRGGDHRPKLMGDSPIELSARGLVDLEVDNGSVMAIHPEVHVAAARINPEDYEKAVEEYFRWTEKDLLFPFRSWRKSAALAQGLGVMPTLKSDVYGPGILTLQIEAEKRLRVMLSDPRLPVLATPDVLQALAEFKPNDLDEVLRKHLNESDVVISATAAGLFADLPPDEASANALIAALPTSLSDVQLNDAALSILDALGKQKTAKANDAIKTALNSPDHLIRRKAVAVLKANGAGDFSSRIGTVQTRNTAADYQRALDRIGRRFDAVVTTSKGSFTIELLPDDAPLSVDNFIQLAKRKYFNGITIHRVVPNFVIQDGDPRGDGNGGPGYQIRCEINESPYQRGAVGMALSGKDTGGSQWFVTHSPQPHLDGGYTVFGNVVTGMDVVDSIARGDVIRSIVITAAPPGGSNRRR
ncbi:MAG: peptidylprolyl isomerase [Pyrinomonadaceae bacterium]